MMEILIEIASLIANVAFVQALGFFYPLASVQFANSPEPMIKKFMNLIQKKSK